MNTSPSPPDIQRALEELSDQGYTVLEGVLSDAELEALRSQVDNVLTEERDAPPETGEAPPTSDDDAVQSFFAKSYTVSQAELARLMKRVRQTRAVDLDTPWPVGVEEINKTFLHLPTLFDQDRSQRIWNLLAKCDAAASLVEHPSVLELARAVLGRDCVLSDCSATSIGSQTSGGAWHVDVPLGQLAEPLPDFPLTTQSAWMLDDFTAENGATRVVPGSHRTRLKPRWEENESEGEVVLAAPAGSVAVWLSNTWHRSGPNSTDHPRRAVLTYYCRSWIKPFHDFRSGVGPQKARELSPTLRYLLGFSSSSVVRG